MAFHIRDMNSIRIYEDICITKKDITSIHVEIVDIYVHALIQCMLTRTSST